MRSGNEDLVLTPEEARRLLRCSRSVVYAGIKNGAIPAIRLGPRKVVIPRARLIALLEGGNDGAEAPPEQARTRGAG